MKNLKNALLLKQLYLQKAMGYAYTEVTPCRGEEPTEKGLLTLSQLQRQIETCHLCTLSKSRKRPLFGTGSSKAKLMIVTNYPDGLEEDSGKVVVGKSAQMLEAIRTSVLRIEASELYVTSFLKCRPPADTPPSPSQIHACKPFLRKQIELVSPQIVVTLGIEVFNWLTGANDEMESVRGILREFEGYKLMPTYPFTYLLRNPGAKKEAYKDWLLLAETLHSRTVSTK